jgi:hypothetical protein
MPKPYSEDLRSRVAEAIAAGNTVRAVALPYKVSPAFACRMRALWRETGAVQGKAFGGLNAPGWNRMKPPQRPAGEQPVGNPQGTTELAGTRTGPTWETMLWRMSDRPFVLNLHRYRIINH